MADYDETDVLKGVIDDLLDQLDVKDLRIEQLEKDLATNKALSDRLLAEIAEYRRPLLPLLTQLLTAVQARSQLSDRAEMRQQKLNELIEKRKASILT